MRNDSAPTITAMYTHRGNTVYCRNIGKLVCLRAKKHNAGFLSFYNKNINLFACTSIHIVQKVVSY